MVLRGKRDGDVVAGAPPCRDSALLNTNRKWPNTQNFHAWKQKIPFFIVSVSVLQVIFFYAANDDLRRVLPYCADRKKEIWRFLTYMLLHANAFHLGLNVSIQGLLGTPLELEQGRLRSAVVYFGGCLAGSLGASAFATFSSMVGGSAGVYAFLTGQIVNVVLNYETIKFAAYRIATLAAFSAADVVYVVCHVYFSNNENPRIAWEAHVSGAVAGVLLGFLLFEGTSSWKRKFQKVSCRTLAFSSKPGPAFVSPVSIDQV